jgi:putative lysine transport system permease protein
MQFFNEVIGIVRDYWQYLLAGVGYTMLIALIGTAAGFLIGLLTGVIRTAPKSKEISLRILQKAADIIITVYIEIFRGTPMMVQAMVIYWGYAFLNGGSTLPLIPAGLFIVSINTGAYMAEIVRGGIISVDKGQLEGAYSVGMTHWQAMVKVVLPQVLRNILPSISNEFVINIKDTSVLNVIGVSELYYMAGVIKRINLQTFQTYTVICVIYFVLTFTVTRALRFVEKKLDGSDSYTICGSGSDSEAEIHITEKEEIPND